MNNLSLLEEDFEHIKIVEDPSCFPTELSPQIDQPAQQTQEVEVYAEKKREEAPSLSNLTSRSSAEKSEKEEKEPSSPAFDEAAGVRESVREFIEGD